jgi:hypothetical protein
MSIGIIVGSGILSSRFNPHNVLPTQQLGAGSLLGAIADSSSPHTSLEIEESLFYPMRQPSAK